MKSHTAVLFVTIAAAMLIWGCPKDEKDDDEQQPGNQSITLTSPNGGETWAGGSTQVISWTDQNVGNVKIWLSTDGGTTWVDIALATGNASSYTWTVLNVAAPSARIRVMSESNTDVFDDSDANFTVTQADAASGTVRSDEVGTIESPGGARIRVPLGAVPRYENGDPGTITFSIEEAGSVTVTPPNGQTVATSAYRFGPEGSVLAQPVEISIPLSPNVNADDYAIYRINPSTNQPERHPSFYDADRRAIVTQTVSFSIWFGAAVPPIPEAWGCLHVNNLSPTTWFRFCVVSFTLEFPALDTQWMPTFAMGGVWSPLGHFSLLNESNFRMPQGTFVICRQFGQDSDPRIFTRDLDTIVIVDPWNESQSPALCIDYPITQNAGPDTGRCSCTATPTLPVGTGAVQVTLTWWNTNPLDLDLWVTDPDSVRCWYADTQIPSGGQLDRDNLCGNYINGQPENIFWTANPPLGLYIVEVDWYSDCGNGIASQEIQVRTVVQGTTRTFTTTITNGQTLEVTRFSVTSGGPMFLPPENGPRAELNKPEKRAG